MTNVECIDDEGNIQTRIAKHWASHPSRDLTNALQSPNLLRDETA
jgi:hypothetical protein